MSTNAISQTARCADLADTRSEVRWWMLPHLLSLDAASVAVAWQIAFAWALRTETGLAEAAVLFLSVWLAYSADRLFDSFRHRHAPRTARHRFASRYRNALLVALPIALAADVAIAWFFLPGASFRSGLALAGAAMLYTLAAQYVPGFARWLFAKELAVGALISWGALWSPLARGASIERALPLFVAAALVCGWNCVAISAWESRVVSGRRSHLRDRILDGLPPYLAPVSLACGAAALACGVATGSLHGLAAGFALACSMPLLGLLQRLDAASQQDLRRVLADVALLVPLLLLLLPQ